MHCVIEHHKGGQHLAARIGVSPSDGEVGSPPFPFAVVRDLEAAAKKRRGFLHLGVLQAGAGRAGRGDPQNSAILRLSSPYCAQLEVWTPS
jgi:hypothetical protein